MNIPPLQSTAPSAADVPLERLAKDRALTDEQKISEVSRQFEALLLRQILSETQKTVIASEFSDNSTASDIYRSMIVDRMADSISKSGALGLAKTLDAQFSQKVSHLPAGHGQPSASQPTAHAGTDALRPFEHSKTHGLPAPEPLHRHATHQLSAPHERDH